MNTRTPAASLVPKEFFPLLREARSGFSYLDSAATTQKHERSLNSMMDFYGHSYANIHRGLYPLAEVASDAYESARQSVADFLHAPRKENIVFTKNATEAINLVAHSYARPFLRPGGSLLVSRLEHHANILPWQNICEQTGASLLVVPTTGTGDVDLEALQQMLEGNDVFLVAISALSNVLGSVQPVQAIASLAHSNGARLLIDAAQSAAHLPTDVEEIDCDFLVFTGHKVYGPDGIGVLYGKTELLEIMPPFLLGGGMIRSVGWTKTEFLDPPYRFEAGTPAIGGAIGLQSALEMLKEVGFAALARQDQFLLHYTRNRLQEIPGLRILGTPRKQVGIISFTMDDIHPHDIASLLGKEGICVRAGHHCAQPLMESYGLQGTIRASFGLYTSQEDIDLLISALHKVQQTFL